MAKGKGQTATYKTLHGKLEIEQHETTENRCSGKVCSSFSTSGTRPVTLVTNPVMNEWMMDEVLNEERTAECLWQVNISVVIDVRYPTQELRFRDIQRKQEFHQTVSSHARPKSVVILGQQKIYVCLLSHVKKI